VRAAKGTLLKQAPSKAFILRSPKTPTGMFVHPRLSKTLSKAASALVCAAAIFGAGCHGPNNISDFGIAWVSVTAEPAPQYASYVVTIDSITLTRSDNTVYTAVATPELVDLTQINNFAELWSSGAIPNGTYIAATITLDYTTAEIAIRKGDVAVPCTLGVATSGSGCGVLDAATKATPTTYALTVVFDPANQPTITPTFASTSAALMTVDIDLPDHVCTVADGDDDLGPGRHEAGEVVGRSLDVVDDDGPVLTRGLPADPFLDRDANMLRRLRSVVAL